MEEVIHFLELKNQCYEKFHNVSKRLLDLVQQNRWETLTSFADTRERILHVIRSFDFRIARAFSSVDVTQCCLQVYRVRVKKLLEDRKNWIQKILVVDLELLSRIDEMKSEGLKELKKSLANAQIAIDDPLDDGTPPAAMNRPIRKSV